jgi:hypothetical protein
MSAPSLLSRLYVFILESRSVDLADLERRFPDEFMRPLRASDPREANAFLAAMSPALFDALTFLAQEEFIGIDSEGRIVRCSSPGTRQIDLVATN